MGRAWTGTAAGFLGLALAGAAAPARAQETTEGPRLIGNIAEIEIGGRVQTQFNTTSVDGEPASVIFLRRVRLEAEVRVNDLVSGKVQPDFAGDEVEVKDAYLKLDLSPAVQVLAGKAYRPFSLLEQTSSTRILPVERGADIRGLDAFDEYELVHDLGYSDRDVGIQVMGAPAGAPLGLAYAIGFFQGPLGAGVGGEATHQLAARATLTPADDLTLGVGWSSRHFAEELAGGVFDLERGHALELDLEYGDFDPGPHLLGEVAFGDFDPFTDSDFFGAQAWFGYRTGPLGAFSTVEPIVRASYGDVQSGVAALGALGGTLLTPGVNLYFGGRNRLMLNYDVWLPAARQEDGASSFKAQFQLAF